MKTLTKIISCLLITIFLSGCNTDMGETKRHTFVNEDKIPVQGQVYDHGKASGLFPVERTTEGIVKTQEEVFKLGNFSTEADFYTNMTYEAGLSGHYTFLVINPVNQPEKEAPLWVYFHGGSAGYFDEDGQYQTKKTLDAERFNSEETFEIMVQETLKPRLYGPNGPRDNSIVKRIKEGYRVLVLSYSDHDCYLGVGNEYPNNPNGGQVNGLQASMAAIDYTVNQYPTTHVFTHGSSAGAAGAYHVGLSYYMEGTRLTGIISDSHLPAPEMTLLYGELGGHEDYHHTEHYDIAGMLEKIGPMADFNKGLYPEAMIEKGFDVPMLGLAGRLDSMYADDLYLMPMAKDAGYESNIDWLHGGIIHQIEKQENSPHKVILLDNADHVPSITGSSMANDYVDQFIQESIAYNGHFPFGKGSYQEDIEAPLGQTMTTYVYKESFGQDIELDFYLPESSPYEDLPVLVFFHGGGYIGGTKGDANRMFDDGIRGAIRSEYLENGYAIVSANYILAKEKLGSEIEDSWTDGKDCIRWLRKNADTLGIDPNNIGVMGSSAGGGMATMLGYTDDQSLFGDPDLSAYSSSVNYVINMWGAAHHNVEPYDITKLTSFDDVDDDYRDYMNGRLFRIGLSEEDDFETIQARSVEMTPTTYLDENDPPTISFYGLEDVTTHASQGIYLHETLDSLGIDNQLYLFEGEGHGLKGLSAEVIEEHAAIAFDFGHALYQD